MIRSSQLSCLFITEDWPLTPNAVGGASALIYSHLELFHYMGCKISLVILTGEGDGKGFARYVQEQAEIWHRVQSWCECFQQIPLHLAGQNHMTLAASYITKGMMWTTLPKLNKQTTYCLQKFLEKSEPDLIWAEHLLPTAIMAQLSLVAPIVYSHHDWQWRIKAYRLGNRVLTWRGRFRFWLRRRQEESLVRWVDACVSASASEADEIRAMGARRVANFPTTYHPIDLDETFPGTTMPYIVHLGGMQTTANRIGLERFLDITWPLLQSNLTLLPELWIIGSLEGAPQSLREKLTQVRAVCPGYVTDLTVVLRPFDLHIIPWEHNTGTRTRIPLALSYGQALVSTRAGAACLPELYHDENCVLVQNLEEMAQEIILLIADKTRRHRLASAGRDTFEKQYTREAVQPRFNQFLGELET